jgi:uncharacterized protein YyaL (SSP411 family)
MPVFGHFILQSVKDTWDIAPLPKSSRNVTGDDEAYLRAAAQWLRRSIEVQGNTGSAHSYRLFKGWMPPYPETTGYILKTFLRLAAVGDREENRAIARRLADWLVEVQLPNGGIVGRHLGKMSMPVVFNTGMVLLGFNAIHKDTGDEKYLQAASRAADFLLGCQDEDGCFRRHTSNGIIHTYNARTAWALVELGQISGLDRYRDGGERNLSWVLRQQTADGFFLNNAFKPGGNANTHGLAYVLSGLIESYLLTGNDDYLKAVRKTAEQVVSLYDRHGRLAAEIGEDWRFLSSHICLTGYCQLAIVLMQLFAIDRDHRQLSTALRLIDDVKATVDIRNTGKPHHGAVKGSHPIYGSYARLQYPNWATKFFIDALLLKAEVMWRSENSVLAEASAGEKQAVAASH